MCGVGVGGGGSAASWNKAEGETVQGWFCLIISSTTKSESGVFHVCVGPCVSFDYMPQHEKVGHLLYNEVFLKKILLINKL